MKNPEKPYKKPKAPKNSKKREPRGPSFEGGSFMTDQATANRLKEVMTPGAEILYVTGDKDGNLVYHTFEVPPK